MTITATKSDATLKTDVLAELACDTTVDETEVGVQVKSGIVTLTGTLTSYPKKLAAIEAAHRVYGVLDVVDDMKVKIPAIWERTDERLASDVRHALQVDVLAPDQRITSTVSGGHVTLQGTVDLWSDRLNAERAVQRLTGVRGVTNQISVASTGVRADEVKRRIEDALRRQSEREARQLGVTVSDGTVTLSGAVRSWSEKSAAQRTAQFMAGVRRVDDRITVDPYL